MPFSSFGQLSSLDYLSAPALQNFAGIQIFAASQVQTNFEFDAGGNRARQIKQRIAAGDASRQLEETLYLGTYEREYHRTRPVGSGTFVTDRTVHRHSLGGFAVYTRTDSPATGSVTKLTTILKDHLGSTDVLYTGTWNGSAFASPATERQSFDPWGERRDPATLVSYRATDTDAFRASAQDYDRGYTGHEQLDDSGLIHMNGRLYDPELGRMLSPDPFVQVPEYSQNFNRYSYVMNNPLNLTDPTGFDWLGDFGAKMLNKLGRSLGPTWCTVLVIVTRIVVTAYAGPIWGSTASAGLQAGLNGGSASDIRRAEAIGFAEGLAFQGVNTYTNGLTGSVYTDAAPQTAGHGVVGGTVNYSMGRKFSDGFYSAAVANELGGLAGAFGAYDNVITGTIASGVVGGTASVVGGGKFANGAWTSAFAYLAPDLPRMGMFQGVIGGVSGMAAARSWQDVGRSALQLIGLPRDFFPFSGWEAAPTGGRLPPSLNRLLKAAGGDEDTILGKGIGALNGHKAWHGGTNAGIAYSIGPVGAAFQFLGGVFHEIDVWSKDAAIAEYDNQGGVNQVLDSSGDILANAYGMGVGYLSTSPGLGVPFAMKTANYIPGPTDPWKTRMPTYHKQNPPNPANAWGGYP